jgi:hypothetical protein
MTGEGTLGEEQVTREKRGDSSDHSHILKHEPVEVYAVVVNSFFEDVALNEKAVKVASSIR